jgi:hypothetical protein
MKKEIELADRESILRDIKTKGGNKNLIEMTEVMDDNTLIAFHRTICRKR